jgi:plasmid maintenance system antidote protein VapI
VRTLQRPEALRALIRAHGWSDGAFAKLIGRPRTTVNNWVTGRRRRIDDATAELIVEHLGSTRDILFAPDTSTGNSPKVAGEGTAA